MEHRITLTSDLRITVVDAAMAADALEERYEQIDGAEVTRLEVPAAA